MSDDLVWIGLLKAGHAYLLNVDTGAHRLVVNPQPVVSATGGYGRVVQGRLVAWFVHPRLRELFVKIGQEQFAGREIAEARATRRLKGLRSDLTLTTVTGRSFHLHEWTPGNVLADLVDPARDDLDREIEDFLGDFVQVADPEWRAWILTRKDPAAGPWHLVADRFP